MFEDVFPVLLLMLLCIPVLITLIRDIFHEKEIESLRQQVENNSELLLSLLGVVEPRQLVDADLPPYLGPAGGDRTK